MGFGYQKDFSSARDYATSAIFGGLFGAASPGKAATSLAKEGKLTLGTELKLLGRETKELGQSIAGRLNPANYKMLPGGLGIDGGLPFTNTQGTLTNRSEYDAFGLQSSTNQTSNSIGYTGQRLDAEMNLFSAIVRSHIFGLFKFLKILKISRSQIFFLKIVGTLDNAWVDKYNAVPQTDNGVFI